VAVSTDGKQVYLCVAARDGDAVAVFGRDTTSGAITWQACFRDVESTLTGCPSAQGLDNPHGASVSPDGTSVYFSSEIDDTVTTFARHTTTGALTYGGCMRDFNLPANGCTGAEGLHGANTCRRDREYDFRNGS